MIVLLDTTVLIDMLRGDAAMNQYIATMVEANHVLTTSAMNVAEIHAGLRPNEIERSKRLFARIDLYPITVQIAKRAGDLKRAWSLKGRTLELPDTIVAATALEYGLTLMTGNRKDFPMDDLKFFNLPPV